MTKSKTIFISHRGESFDAPENTLASINLAWERKVDAVEVDVRITKDNHIVVIHDKDTARVCNKKLIIKKSFYSELPEIIIGKGKQNIYCNEQIPLLSDVIETIPAGNFLFIDIKSGKNTIPFLNKIIKLYYSKFSSIKFISSNNSVLSLLKKRMPEINCYKIFKFKWYQNKLDTNYIIRNCKKLNIDGVDIMYNNFIDRNFIDTIKNEGLKFFVWTVNDPQKASKLLSLGVDGITTDRGEWLKKQVSIK